MSLLRLLFVFLAAGLCGRAQEINPEISVQRCTIGSNEMQKYFLIEHKTNAQTAKARGLILILPGGPGSADFLPFCANVLTLYGIPDDFVAAELVAPQWTTNEDRVVWPSRTFPDPQAKFTSEQFLEAVTKDVCRLRQIDERFIFTLGWSSSGHVLYSASLSDPKVRGSIIAMSRFLPDRMPNPGQARGKNYFLYHSPQDQICPYREAQLTEHWLKEHGANVKLVSYSGGHGWVPDTYYCDRLKEAIEWLRSLNIEPAANRSQPARSETNVPEGRMSIAQPFQGWVWTPTDPSPEGTADLYADTKMKCTEFQPSLRD